MKVISRLFQILIITCLCYFMHSSSFVYHTNMNANNVNVSKKLDYITLESEQYASYQESLFTPISSFNAELTGYGADCEGCSGILACAPITNVFENGIYFEDASYGTVRVVAASREFPCGTIMMFKSKKLDDEPIIAIVMDRGGVIVDNRLDLLTESEAYSEKYVGRIYDLKVDVLRRGWK